MILAGIAGLSLSNTRFVKRLSKQDAESERLINDSKLPPLEPPNEEQATEKKPLLGLAFAITLGILNGSMMVPNRFAPKAGTVNLKYSNIDKRMLVVLVMYVHLGLECLL
jgi:hypothetical protein